MEDQLDYLIRTLTYKRSQLELEMNAFPTTILLGIIQRNYHIAKMDGLNIAINEILKLAEEMSNE